MEGLVCSLGVLYQPSIYLSMRTVLQQRVIHDYGREGKKDFTDSIDYAQYKFSCCGIVSPTDYQNSVINRWRTNSQYMSLKPKLEVPKTCCKLLNKGVSCHCQ